MKIKIKIVKQSQNVNGIRCKFLIVLNLKVTVRWEEKIVQIGITRTETMQLIIRSLCLITISNKSSGILALFFKDTISLIM